MTQCYFVFLLAGIAGAGNDESADTWSVKVGCLFVCLFVGISLGFWDTAHLLLP